MPFRTQILNKSHTVTANMSLSSEYWEVKFRIFGNLQKSWHFSCHYLNNMETWSWRERFTAHPPSFSILHIHTRQFLSRTHTYTQYCLVNWLNINSVPPVLQQGCVEQYSVLQMGLLAVNSPESSNPSRTEGSDWHSPDSCQSDLYESNTQHSTFCVENI